MCFVSYVQDPVSPLNGTASPRENGIDKLQPKKEHIGPHRYAQPLWSLNMLSCTLNDKRRVVSDVFVGYLFLC